MLSQLDKYLAAILELEVEDQYGQVEWHENIRKMAVVALGKTK